MSNTGHLFVISGPSGTGKGTVIRQLMKIHRNLYYSVSATTRQPRPGEIEGVSYFFLTHEEFEERIRTGKMLEYAEYCGNYYGTPKTPVDEMLLRGRDVILEIEVKGAMNVKKARPEAKAIFLMPPSEEELARRLRGRATEDEKVVQGRLRTARTEMALAENYDFVVVNDVVERAAREIEGIIEGVGFAGRFRPADAEPARQNI